MGLSFFNAERDRQAREQKEISTSPVNDGVEVEKVEEKIEEVQPIVEEPKPKKKKTK